MLNKRRSATILSIILACACWIVAGLLRPLYTSVDNFTISTVTNGLYGNEYYCIYLHPLLCTLIKRISVILPSADAFLLLGHFLVLFETAWLLFLSMVSRKSILQRIAYSGLVLFSTIAISLFNTNYTIQGASFVFTGCLTLFLANDQHKRWYNVIGFLFAVFGTMWRVQAALIFIPFIALEFLSSVFENKGKTDKYQCHGRYGIYIVVILSVLISQNVINNSSEYADAVKYDQARITLEDFPTRSWDEIEGELKDVEEIEFEAVKNWFLADTDRLTPELLSELAKAASTTKYSITPTGIVSAFIAMIAFIVGNSKTVWITITVVVLVFLRVISGHLSFLRKLESIFAVLGGLIILLYFTILGRAPLRVWYPVIYAILLILLLQMSRLSEETECKTTALICSVLIIGVSFFGVAVSIFQNGIDTPSTALMTRSTQSDERYIETYSEDSLFFWGGMAQFGNAVLYVTRKTTIRRIHES